MGCLFHRQYGAHRCENGTDEEEYRPVLGGEHFLTDKEVAERLKISRRTLQEYRNEGRIAYIQLGGKIIYKESDIERLLKAGYHEAYYTDDF